MQPSRVDFYDPLYDFITLEEAFNQRPRDFLDIGFAPKSVSTDSESDSPLSTPKLILPFLSSIEFTRQGFLRQSNLAFLVYPSASHTRLAHSVGACYLGYEASKRICVGIRTKPSGMKNPIYLSKFLDDTGWREEFYLSLLLHDVGHFPFSHTIENNKEFWEAFKKEIHHEDAACQLIQGEGAIWRAAIRRVEGISKRRRKDHPHLADLFGKIPEIDRNVICYLISGKVREYLSAKESEQIAELQVVHALVSGLLDLDRVDHYRRDNLFTGLRAGTSLNFPSLLSGITVYYNSEDATWPPELHLQPGAIGAAISLLQTKERLTEDCFEHPDNMAYEAMLNQAFNTFVLGDNFYESDENQTFDEDLVYDLLVSTDDELLFRLSQKKSKAVREIVFRILNRSPYRAITKLSFQPEHRLTIREIRKVISRISRIKRTNIVLRPSKGFGSKNLKYRSEEWLNLERLLSAEGRRLVDGKYKRQIEHFKQGQESPDLLWVYSPDNNVANRLSGLVQKICKELGCQQEDI